MNWETRAVRNGKTHSVQPITPVFSLKRFVEARVLQKLHDLTHNTFSTRSGVRCHSERVHRQ
jgi:hypothetical protein